ncbi:hypothetical protein ACFLT7_05910, partial [candidate division KSB1 bacterium]
MFERLPNCIFCDTSLPELRSGVGEHIFPESIFGFWRSYNVCSDCQTALGEEVDCLATQNIELLNAVEALELRNINRHLDNLAWHGKDTLDKRRVRMAKVGSKVRIKVTNEHDFLECSEQDLDKLAKPWLRERTRGRISNADFETEYSRLKSEYPKLNPGESYHSNEFGYAICRREVGNFKVDNPTPPSFTRLIAKIVTYFMHYVFPYNKLKNMDEFQMLTEHARYGNLLKPFTINPLSRAQNKSYNTIHQICFHLDDLIILVDTTFFGKISWR